MRGALRSDFAHMDGCRVMSTVGKGFLEKSFYILMGSKIGLVGSAVKFVSHSGKAALQYLDLLEMFVG